MDCAFTRPAASGKTPVRVDKLSPRILYADDDPTLRTLGQRMLIHLGYDVDTAVDGKAAWAALHATQYDLLITDNEMPHLSGIELVRAMRQSAMTMPIIVISGTFDSLSPEELRQVEGEAKLPKPFTIGQLSLLVDEVLRAAAITPSPNSVHMPAVEVIRPRIQPQ